MTTPNQPSDKPLDLAIGVPAGGDGEVTARMAGGLVDMNLSISPRQNPVPVALRNLAKAINLALKNDFLETDLDGIYKVARVWKGQVQIMHKDYIGLGDGLFASVGRRSRCNSPCEARTPPHPRAQPGSPNMGPARFAVCSG